MAGMADGFHPPLEEYLEAVLELEEEGTVVIQARLAERAVSVVRKHRLAERLLTDIIGLPWHKAHIEACRWEHVISDEVEARLVTLLGNPQTCPHGNPIPGSGAQPVRDLVPLSALHGGEHVRLERVTE